MLSSQWVRSVMIVLTVTLLSATVRAEGNITLSKGQTVYVPVYSHIYAGDKEHPLDLAATLSIRNTDLIHPISILSADYRDSQGQLIRGYLEKPIQLNAMASTRYVIKESDKSGGSGASFVVKWRSDQDVNVPIMESVMITTKSQLGLSFTSRGQATKEHYK